MIHALDFGVAFMLAVVLVGLAVSLTGYSGGIPAALIVALAFGYLIARGLGWMA